MTERELELQECLDGFSGEMEQPFWKLAEILELQVLEICKPSDQESKDLWIPYMMNDAVENYLILKNCKMTGEFVLDKKVILPAKLVKEEAYILVVRQEGGSLFTLRFQEIEERMDCYQYHRIGHFWVPGHEQWRQLVYMLGTIHDKYEYIGENACNDFEIELMPLMEFPPLRFYSPIHESLEDKYPFTCDGLDCMERVAEEAKDGTYARMVRFYRRFPFAFVGKLLRNRLEKPRSENIYRLIFGKMKEASEMYPERKYELKMQQTILEKREKIEHEMYKKGWKGNYPYYKKPGMQVYVTEEHPFTLDEFEYENYQFRVQFMVSKVRRENQNNLNSGFFCGYGRKGYIVKEMKEIT